MNWAIRSRNCWMEIGNSTGLWYDPVGSLHLAYHEDEWLALQELFSFFKKEGRNVQLLNTEQVSRISPVAKKENCRGGLFSAEEIIVDPREAIAMLPVYLENKLGVQFYWGKAVTEVHTGYIHAEGQESGRSDLYLQRI